MKPLNILTIIPARGGSKGIPRKNVRLLHNRPLIFYSINNAKNCSKITDIVVTSDDAEILSIAKQNYVETLTRDAALAGDAITLDPVIYDAVVKMEERKKCCYDIIITMQPTSPLLKSSTLEKAIECFIKDDKDSYISVVNRAHLTWSKTVDGYSANYSARVNRQQLPPLYFETGAFFISRRDCVTPNGRLGEKVSIFEVPEDESVDIDSADDWIICENRLNKKRIVFRVDGHKMLGMGHIYHSLTLAYSFIGHDIMFVTKKQYSEGVNKIQSTFMPYTLIETDADFFSFLKKWKADIVINDCLDTQADYIQTLKSLVKRVITIEDLGEGSKYADAVINAMYYDEGRGPKYFFGEKYHCLRDEFISTLPKEYSQEIKNVLVIFGGTDPANLTRKLYEVTNRLHTTYPDMRFIFITGSGYDALSQGIVTDSTKNITVLNDVKRVSEYMQQSDLAFTSQGRTVFELASLGVPSIVLAQNEREQLHTFAQMQNGFVNLGLGAHISVETIEATFKWLVETPQIRLEMRELMLTHDLKKGVKRVADIILQEE